jgi:hypothetical protein
MKKFGIIALAALLVVAFTMPAAAVENIFGGYMRVRAWTQQNFTGEDQTQALDLSNIDQRTRIYYTAKFSDNFKMVNKFEWDMDWGKDGDFGVDFKGVEIKNAYIDFSMGDFNFKLGAQGATLARGFLFADDFAGAAITYNGDGFSLPFYWLRAYEGGYDINDANDQDFDYFAVAPKFKAGDMATVQPIFAYVYSKDGSGLDPIAQSQFAPLYGVPVSTLIGEDLCEVGIFFVGANVDLKLDAASLWFTALYEGGNVDSESGDNDFDVSAYLVALGGSTNIGAAGIHGQVFYATGQDLDDDSDELNAFWVPSDSLYRGQSYYWAEIMGYGIFDDDFPTGSPAGDKISNIMAGNIGVSFKALENTTLTADLWYAQHQEDDALGNNDLGTEIDLKSKTKLMDNLNLELVAAMLIAGDATALESDNDANPWELGARLSLSF